MGVALTRPFRFEGARRLEQADALIEIMEEVASLTVSILRVNSPRVKQYLAVDEGKEGTVKHSTVCASSERKTTRKS